MKLEWDLTRTHLPALFICLDFTMNTGTFWTRESLKPSDLTMLKNDKFLHNFADEIL